MSSYDADWQEKYAALIATSDEAVAQLKPGQRVFIGTGCGEPLELVRALTRNSSRLPDTEIVHLLTFGEAPYAHEDLAKSFRVNSFFIAENVRDVIQEGLGDYTPVFLSEIPRLFRSGQLPLDVALIQVTPPDEAGMVSLGVSVDIVKSAAENASLVIAQVNPSMPRTLGDSQLHVFHLDVLVPIDEPILETSYAEVTAETRRIAEYVSALVEDGSTLELGIGGIPHALLEYLKDKKDLGIHTEMFTDGIVDLIEAGVDALNPVQVSAGGMNPAELVRQYGKDIAFWGGGIDTQHALNASDPEVVRADVRRRLKEYGPDASLVFTQVHNIQYDVPAENILAMRDEFWKQTRG